MLLRGYLTLPDKIYTVMKEIRLKILRQLRESYKALSFKEDTYDFRSFDEYAVDDVLNNDAY